MNLLKSPTLESKNHSHFSFKQEISKIKVVLSPCLNMLVAIHSLCVMRPAMYGHHYCRQHGLGLVGAMLKIHNCNEEYE